MHFKKQTSRAQINQIKNEAWNQAEISQKIK